MPKGPQLRRLLLAEEAPHRKQVAMVESVKFRRWTPARRYAVLRVQKISRILQKALDELPIRLSATRIPILSRHATKYPFPGMTVSMVSSHLNEQLWSHGWCIAVGAQEVRELVRKNLARRVPRVVDGPIDYNDMSPAGEKIIP